MKGVIKLIGKEKTTLHAVFITLLISFVANCTYGQIQHSDSTRYLRINRIVILGNDKTRDHIITRELSLQPGDLIYEADIPSILAVERQRLMNLRLFNTVDLRTLELEPEQIDLIIEVTERWYTFPVPIFTLIDRNFNEWWQNYDHDFNRVNYGLRLYQYNMRGRNELLRFTAQFGYTRKFEVNYRMPYIDREQKHGLEIKFQFDETKNLAVRTTGHKLDFLETEELLRITREAELIYIFRNSFYDYHRVGFKYRDAEISDTVQLLNPEYFRNELTRLSYKSFYYEFIHDRRDFVSYPLKGNYYYVHIEKNGIGNDDIDKTEAYAGYARFMDLNKGFYLSNLAYGYASTSRNIPYFMYAALGYNKLFIRGFERYVVEGSHFALNKLTLKKLLFARTYRIHAMPIEQFRHLPVSVYLKIYGDAGYVKNYPDYPQGERFSDKLISGTGIGIDIVGSYDFVFRTEYSLNSFGEHGIFLHIKKEF